MVAAAMSAVLLAPFAQALPAPAKPTPPPAGIAPQQDTPIPGVALKAKQRPADPAVAAAARTAARSGPPWPAAGAAEVDLPQANARTAGAGAPVRAGTTPVWVDRAAAPGMATAAAAPARLRVQVYDRATTEAAGVRGLLLRLDRADGPGAGASTRVSVDYTGFASAYGGDWAARLRLVSMPACAVSTPQAPGCTTVTELDSTNDRRTGRVSAVVSLPAAPPTGSSVGGGAGPALFDGGAVLALSAGTQSGDGDYSVTSLTPSSTWSVDGNSGGFSWAYAIRTPPSLGGPAPSLALAYSSQSMDGKTAATNNQPGWMGEGFELWSGFIERSYKACADDMDGTGHNNTEKTGDLCWETDNATLSLSGHSGELIRDASNPNRWHLRDDDGSLVMRETGAGNGDDNGEWWVVTTSDGTQYWFGGVPSANSTWTVPVFGNDPNEPCNKPTFAASSCSQSWRWNLDFVVDPHGNTLSYTYVKESNKYGRNKSTTDLVSYDRGGSLETISYGTRQGGSGPAPMQVGFVTADRCLSSCGIHDAAHWPDVLWDQECTASPCTNHSPTYWTTRRLSTITTRVWDPARQPAPGYKDVERWTFTHSFPDTGDGTRAGLWLSRLSQTGLVGTATSVPDLVFSGTQLQNRVDTIADQLFPMNWWRIARIDTETGGATIVTYAPQQCAAGTANMPDPSALQNNTLRCFPVRWTPEGYLDPITDYFHKYVVSQVREGDLTGGAPDVVHAYEYVGGAAWHYTDDDGLVKAADKTWSVWRGYATVRIRDGDPANTTQTLTETRYFRGMNGDHLPSGARAVSLPAIDMNGDGDTTDSGVDAPAVPDEDAYAGTARTTVTYNGVGGAEVVASVTQPWQSDPTATRSIHGSTVHARHTGVQATRDRVVLDTDGGTRAAGVRSTSELTTFDAEGMPIEVEDRGDAAPGDETCTLTEYARRKDVNNNVWLTSYPVRVRTFAVDCMAAKGTGLGDADVTGDVKTLYDGQSFGAAPTKGDATEAQTLRAYNGGNPTFLTVSRSAYDAYGRVTDAWDVDNNHTTTAYTPTLGGPLTATTTTNQLGWTNTTTFEPAWGRSLSTVDANGKRTEAEFDGLGRTVKVWLPGQDRSAGQNPTMGYSYDVRADGATAVTSRTLNPAGAYVTTVTLYDGLLRVRQNQAPDASIAGARVITDTLYDSAGRVSRTAGPYTMTGGPSTDIYVPRPPDYSGPEALPNWTTSVYDGAGRLTDAVFYVRNVEKWRTRTAYTGDRTDVSAPAGGTGTSRVTDARGNTVALRQYHGPNSTGQYDTTTYTYNRKNQLVRVTDPAGNRWDYAFDVRGRQIQADDPDKGRTTTTYDDAGRTVTTTDSMPRTVAYTYDQLGRKTSVRDGSVTGPKRAEWVYDTVAKGQLTRSTRYDPIGGAYTFEIQTYSAGYQPGIVKYTLPGTETGFGPTSFSYTTDYTPDGSIATSRIPAAGGLGLETLTYGYSALGQPTTLNTNLGGTLVTATAYTNYGEQTLLTLRNNAGKIAQIGTRYEEGTRRLVGIKTTSASAPTATYADISYSYDPAGNINKIVDATSGDNQCFQYDYLRRLTEAWTPLSGDCTAAPSVAGLGGPARYWQSWTFDAVGNRRTQTDRGIGAETTATYTYPAAGGAQPHTVRSVAYTGGTTRTDAYEYDPIGNTTDRPGGAAGQELAWDAEGHLTSVTDSTGITSFVYDANGNRLIRKDPTGKTLYLPGQEVRFTTASGTTSATRYYVHGGKMIATRTPAGLSWMSADHQGTTAVMIPATTQVAAVRRTKPYGEVRGTTGTWPASMDRGLVGGTRDPTGLTHLGAREYDPTIGRFISLDPIVNQQDPQQLQGYAYANNTPVTASDPSGLIGCVDSCDTADQKSWIKEQIRRHQQDHTRRHNRARDVAVAIVMIQVTAMGGNPAMVSWEESVPGGSKNGTGKVGKADIVYVDEEAGIVYVWEVKKGTLGSASATRDIAKYKPHLARKYPGMDVRPGFNLFIGPIGVVVSSPHPNEAIRIYNGSTPGAVLYDVIPLPKMPPRLPEPDRVRVPQRIPTPQPITQPNRVPKQVRVPTPEHGPCGGPLACPRPGDKFGGDPGNSQQVIDSILVMIALAAVGLVLVAACGPCGVAPTVVRQPVPVYA
jgi:RHS repeat-associated protein